MYKNHKGNFHSHTYLCGHAGGVPVDYVEVAIEKKYKQLGISEHGPMSNLKNENSRLKEEDYELYIKLLDEAKELANSNGIEFFKGFEIEYFKHMDVYNKYLEDMDYLILGQHFIYENEKYKSTYALSTLEDIILYKDTIIEAIKTNHFNMVCHPDLCFYNIENPTEEMYQALFEIIPVAIEHDIVLELNANGIRRSKYEHNNTDYEKFKYPRLRFFEEAAKQKAKVLVSSDAHSPDALDDWAIEEAYKYANDLNVNLVYELNMKYRNK